jgi:hypothetical protein
MKRTKIPIVVIILLVVTVSTLSASNRTEIYEAYISGDMVRWKQVLDQMEKEPNKTNTFMLELVNYEYGYIGWCLGVKRNKEANYYLSKAEKYIKTLESRSYNLSSVYAYKSLFIGYRVMLTPIKAPILGMKCLSTSEKALELNKSNPFANIQQGNTIYYKPKILGGSYSDALDFYLKAEKLMDANPVAYENDWNYLNLLATIGKCYQLLEKPDKSRAYIDKALKAEPRFTWIKNDKRPVLKVNM